MEVSGRVVAYVVTAGLIERLFPSVQGYFGLTASSRQGYCKVTVGLQLA